jgi:hypothetical protein
MVKDYSYNNVLFSASEFNSKESDLSKVLYIIDKLKEVKFYGDVNETIRRILSSLYFGFNFNYSDDNVKADLKLKESLTYEDRTTKKLSIVGSKGDLVEVKYKKYNDDGYLSEFFKVDSTDKNVSLMIENMSQIPKVINLRETFDVFMSSLVNNLLKTIKGGDGEKIIDHLTKDLTGIIFKNDILVPKENIAFYWNNVGYANRSRLSIWYKVSENPTLYKISKINEGYTRFIQKI